MVAVIFKAKVETAVDFVRWRVTRSAVTRLLCAEEFEKSQQEWFHTTSVFTLLSHAHSLLRYPELTTVHWNDLKRRIECANWRLSNVLAFAWVSPQGTSIRRKDDHIVSVTSSLISVCTQTLQTIFMFIAFGGDKWRLASQRLDRKRMVFGACLVKFILMLSI